MTTPYVAGEASQATRVVSPERGAEPRVTSRAGRPVVGASRVAGERITDAREMVIVTRGMAGVSCGE